MSKPYELTAQMRSTSGKGDSRRMRRLENKIPAIIYGGEKEPTRVSLDHNVLANAIENESFFSHVLTLTIDGKKEKVVLKDLHRHPSKPKIIHADFMRVSAKTKITMLVPFHFKGGETSPGVKNQGGVISHLMAEVEIRCLPGDLPEFIEVDLSTLSLGDSIHLSELTLPKGVEITALLPGEAHDQPVVSVHKPTVAPVEPGPAAEAYDASQEQSSPEV